MTHKAFSNFLAKSKRHAASAEITEGYALLIEDTLFSKPACIFNAIDMLENETKYFVVKHYLMYPLYHEKEDVFKVIKNSKTKEATQIANIINQLSTANK